MTKEEKLLAKKLDSERRKSLWKAKEIQIKHTEAFKQSILKISYDIDQIFYGHKKLKGFYDD